MVHITSPYPVPPSAPDKNVHHCLFDAPGQDTLPDFVLHIDATTGRTQTCNDFRGLVRDGATALASPVALGGLGLQPGKDIVGIFSHNCIDYVALANALLVLTVPFVPVSSFSTPFELVHAVRTSGATTVFVEPTLLPRLLAVAEAAGLPETAIHILEGEWKSFRSFRDLAHTARTLGIPRASIMPATKDTLAYLVFSSGTTGLPKAVMTTHGNIWSLILSMGAARMFEDKTLNVTTLPASSSVILMCLPFYHTYGISLSLVRPFFVRATGIILPKWDRKAVIEAVPRYRITSIFVVPSMMHQLVNDAEFQRADFTSVVSVNSGAARLPPALAKHFQTFTKNSTPAYSGFGTTEALCIARRFPSGCFNLTVPQDSVGVLFPGVQARIVRQDGTEADYDEPGELWVAGPAVAVGYHNNEEANKETFIEGWVRTGDAFRVDKQGFLYFVDRIKDTLKVGGAQVSPTEIEDVLMAQPDKLIIDVCVAGVSGGRTSDERIPRAWVVLSETGKQRGSESALRTLDEWVKDNLSKYKWLRGGFEIVEEIPKNPTGKVLRRVLQDQYERCRGQLSARL